MRARLRNDFSAVSSPSPMSDQHRAAAMGAQQVGGLRRVVGASNARGVDDVDRRALGVHRQGAQRSADLRALRLTLTT